MKLTIGKLKDGGYFARLDGLNPWDTIEAYGSTPFEAKINVFAIRAAIARQMLSIRPVILTAT